MTSSLPVKFLVTATSPTRHEEAWFVSLRSALYFYNTMRWASKVERCTLHEYDYDTRSFSIRAACDNKNFSQIHNLRRAQERKELASTVN